MTDKNAARRDASTKKDTLDLPVLQKHLQVLQCKAESMKRHTITG